MYGLYIHYQIIFVYTARCYDYRQTMFIIQLCLTVMPLLCITTANTNIFSGHAVKDFPVDSNATIMAFGDPKGACKFMFLDPKSNTTCCYSNKASELCHADKQSSSCRSPETAVVTSPTGRCQLLLIRIQESDQGEYDITFPDHLLDNARRLQINVTNSLKGFLPPPYDENEEEERGTWILLSAGIGWIVLASSIGYIIVSKYNCVTEEDLDDQ